MCGTGTVGSGAIQMPLQKTLVAGAAGGGDVAGATGGGDTSSIMGLLTQIAASIEALRQAILGGALAGAVGGGDMAGCDMMGGGAGGDSAAVDGANDGADAIGGGHVHQTVDQSDVADDTGSGKDDEDDEDDSDVAGDAGGGTVTPPAKSDVDGAKGDPTQKSVEQTAAEEAKAALDAADRKVVDAKAASTKADAAVVTAKDDVSKAETALADAQSRKVDADKALVDAGAALTAARKANGEHVANGSQTLEQIALRYGTTLAKLQELNPSITVLGSLPADTKVKLPAGVGVTGKVAEAQSRLDAARAAANAAAKAVTDAMLALEAAREAVRQAEAAAAAAKKAAEDAEKAAAEAKKAAEEAEAARAKAEADAKAAEDSDPAPTKITDPTAARRPGLQENITNARAELDRIKARMDALAAERTRLEAKLAANGGGAGTQTAVDRLRAIRAEFDGLRSAGGHFSKSIAQYTRRLNKIPAA